ncbi:zinc-binding dehydrogenase [Sphingopyxis panaciterrae]
MLVDLPDPGEPGPTAFRSRRHQLDLVRGVNAVHIRPMIDRSFPLAEIADAFRFQESGGHFGKIVVEF